MARNKNFFSKQPSLTLSPGVFEKCNKAILISGAARSGTTIMGQIIHSMKNVEYLFEPPVLFSLIPLIDIMDKRQWMLLYETYLYEEFLVDAVAGRRLNFNTFDDSAIISVKDKKIIDERISKSWRKRELGPRVEQSVVAYKMPDVTNQISMLQKYYPGTKVVLMIRGANDVFHSIKRKGWFTDEALRRGSELWPNRLYKKWQIPHFVDPADIEDFISFTEVERMAYYYLRVYKNWKKIKNCFVVQYDDLIQDPEKTVSALAKKLGLAYGEKTKGLIESVKLSPKDRSENFLELLSPTTRRKIENI